MTLPTATLPLARQAPGLPIPSIVWNYIEEWTEYLAATITVAQAAVVHSSGSVSVPNGPGALTGAWASDRTYPTFNTVDYDPLGMSNLSGGGHLNQVLTVLSDGLYIAFAAGQFAANANGFRDISLDLGGDASQNINSTQGASAGGSFPTYTSVSQFRPLTAGTQVAVRADQNSGGALSFIGASLGLVRVALSAS
jgi:hypothetical protein